MASPSTPSMRCFSRLAKAGSVAETESWGPLTSRVVLDFTLPWSEGVLSPEGGGTMAGC